MQSRRCPLASSQQPEFDLATALMSDMTVICTAVRGGGMAAATGDLL